MDLRIGDDRGNRTLSIENTVIVKRLTASPSLNSSVEKKCIVIVYAAVIARSNKLFPERSQLVTL